MIVIVFGVSGAGKTTIGKLLSYELGWHFYEADDFHSRANIEKMRRPESSGLTDEDRWPWLENLRELLQRCVEASENAVLACSALKRAYRERLRVSDEVKFVFLRGDYALIEKQLRQRRGHFMNPELLRSQFADLEEPNDAVVVGIDQPVEAIVAEIKRRLGSDRSHVE